MGKKWSLGIKWFLNFLQPLVVLLEEKSVLCLISSLLDSVLFTYFQTVFQSKIKQVFMIFSKKSQLIVILLMKIQRSKYQFSQKRVSRVSLQTELSNFVCIFLIEFFDWKVSNDFILVAWNWAFSNWDYWK